MYKFIYSTNWWGNCAVMVSRYSSPKNHTISTSLGSLCSWCPSHRLKQRHTKIAKQNDCSMKNLIVQMGRNLFKQTAGHVRDKVLRGSWYCLELLFMMTRRKGREDNRGDTKGVPYFNWHGEFTYTFSSAHVFHMVCLICITSSL